MRTRASVSGADGDLLERVGDYTDRALGKESLYQRPREKKCPPGLGGSPLPAVPAATCTASDLSSVLALSRNLYPRTVSRLALVAMPGSGVLRQVVPAARFECDPAVDGDRRPLRRCVQRTLLPYNKRFSNAEP